MNADRMAVAVEGAEGARRQALASALAAVPDVELSQNGLRRPDCVLLAVGDVFAADLEHAGRLLASGGAREVLLCGRTPTPEMLLAAMRAGIAEYLVEPLNQADLLAALARLRSRLAPQEQRCETAAGGRIHMVLGAKGGVGTTTIAVNLADALCRLNAGRTALLDLAAPQGETPIFLDLDHTYTWADVAANATRLDATYLESVLARHHSGLAVLPAPGFASESALEGTLLRQMLEILRTRFAHVVLDAGTGHADATVEALHLADEILLVLDLSLPCLARAKRFLEAVRGTQPELAAKLRLVANRKTSESDIGTAEAENILGLRIAWSVVNDYKAALMAINQGRTLAESDPKSAIAKGLAVMARELAPQAPGAVCEAKAAGSLWSRLRSMPLNLNLAPRHG